MSKKRKFRPGERLWSMWGLECAIRDGNWIYLRDKPKHPSILENMTFATLQGFIRRGMLRVAVQIKKEDKNGSISKKDSNRRKESHTPHK